MGKCFDFCDMLCLEVDKVCAEYCFQSDQICKYNQEFELLHLNMLIFHKLKSIPLTGCVEISQLDDYKMLGKQ